MSRTTEGRHVCDRCGADVAAGGVATSVVINDMDRADRGSIVTRNLCRDRTEGEGEDAREVAGCERGLAEYINSGKATDSE